MSAILRKVQHPAVAAGAADMEDADYRALAGFRFELRKFMAFSRKAAERVGLKPQQYQALLAIRSREGGQPVTATILAEELFIGLSTAVELLDRLEAQDLITRRPWEADRRRVVVELTPAAQRILKSLAATHRDELREQVPALMSLLSQMGTRQREPGD